MKLALTKDYWPKVCLPDDVLSAADVRMYDEDQHVYCCCMFPAFETHFLYVSWEPKPGMSDERREWLDEQFNTDAEEVRYLDCSTVRALQYADHTKDAEEETPEEVWESWRESWRCNQSL